MRDDIRVLTRKEVSVIDTYADLRTINNLKVYRFTRKQLEEALKDAGADTKDIKYVTKNLISHPGRYRDSESMPRATNLFILEEHYNKLCQLDIKSRVQWARHEATHLKDITRSEKAIQEEAPFDDVAEKLGLVKCESGETVLGQDENVIGYSNRLLLTSKEKALMQKKGIFVYDIDKTLAKRDMPLLEETIQTIQNLMRAGHLVVIITGQPIDIQRERVIGPIDLIFAEI